MLPESADRGFEAAEVELGGGEAIFARAVLDETVGDAEHERGQRVAAVREQFDDCRTRTTRDRVLLDGDQRGVRPREAIRRRNPVNPPRPVNPWID